MIASAALGACGAEPEPQGRREALAAERLRFYRLRAEEDVR